MLAFSCKYSACTHEGCDIKASSLPLLPTRTACCLLPAAVANGKIPENTAWHALQVEGSTACRLHHWEKYLDSGDLPCRHRDGQLQSDHKLIVRKPRVTEINRESSTVDPLQKLSATLHCCIVFDQSRLHAATRQCPEARRRGRDDRAVG